MARPLRIQYPGALYHVTSRGNERREIFRDDDDRRCFMEILSKSLNIYSVKLYSYVLMKNHFHLLVETPLGNLGEFMRHFNITYTGFYNRKHNRTGHLYQGRYKSILVDRDEYLSIASRYIHLNPVRTRPMRSKTAEEKINYLSGYKWSSLPGYIGRGKDKMVEYGMVLGEYGGDNNQSQQAYQKRIEQDISDGLEIKEDILAQSVLGSAEFIKSIKEKFIKGKHDRESPAHRELKRYRAEDEIIKVIEQETGLSFKEISRSRGTIRQVAMDILYRIGGLKGIEIGEIFEVDYSTVSLGRKRLREHMEKDIKLRGLVRSIEQQLSKLKN